MTAVGMCLFKVDHENTRTMCEIFVELKVHTLVHIWKSPYMFVFL